MLNKIWYRGSVRGGRVQAMASSVDARESPVSGPKVVPPQQLAHEEATAEICIDDARLSECVSFAL